MSARADADDLRPEYDFSPDEYRRAERGRYADRYAAGTNLVPLDADVAEMFPDADAVNGALRALAGRIPRVRCVRSTISARRALLAHSREGKED